MLMPQHTASGFKIPLAPTLTFDTESYKRLQKCEESRTYAMLKRA